MRVLVFRFVWGAALWASVSTLGAQDSSTAVARPGDQVRIWYGERRPREGILRLVDRETVFVTRSEGSTLATSRAAVTRVELFAGRTAGAGAKRGAGIGELVGLVTGLVAAFTLESGCYSGGEKVKCSPALERTTEVAGGLVAIATTIVGALAGGAVGAAFPAPTWREAHLMEPEPSATRDSVRRGPVARAATFSVRERVRGLDR